MAGLRPADVAAVAVTSQYMSIVAIDRSGLPLMNAVMWMDTRGRRHNRHLRTDRRDRTVARSSRPAAAGRPRPHRLHPDEFPAVDAATAAYVEPVDYLNARLSGRIAATQTTAFPLMTMDNRRPRQPASTPTSS